MLCLAVPQGTPSEVHELLKSGGTVVRPQLVDVQELSNMLPLTRALYVDKDTAAPASLQDGSIAYPYSTVQAACDALGGPGGIVLIAPGQYTEPAVSITGGQISLVALGPKSQGSNANVTFNNSVSSVSDLGASNISFINALASSGRIFADNCAITNFSAGAGVSIVQNCAVTNVTCTGTLQAYNTTFTNSTTLAAIESYSCTWQGCSCTGNLIGRNSYFTAAVIVGGTAQIRQCYFGLSLAVTGALTTDLNSIAPILSAVSAFTISPLNISPRVTVSVVVPAVAAGQVGYVDVALGATKLAGMVPAGALLVANPSADLVAAGAGGGFINVRASASNTARFAFLGPLAGGASNFTLGVI